MSLGYMQLIRINKMILLAAFLCVSVEGYAETNSANASIRSDRSISELKPSAILTKPAESGREDYFISADTVIIGCTSGMAAGVLVGSVPMAGAVMSGIGMSESVSLLINLTGMGCGVGAVSSAVAIFTAWMLAP